MHVNIPIWNQYVHLLVLALDGLATLFHSAGLAIIAFTIIVKTILLPLTVKAIRSSKAMQDLQPKIRELQKKNPTTANVEKVKESQRRLRKTNLRVNGF